jgi:acetyltransferase-like isoleucine patch superfamily enzyme
MKFPRIILPVFLLAGASVRPLRFVFGKLGRLRRTLAASFELPGLDPSVECDGRVYVIGDRRVRIGKRTRLGRDLELETHGGVIAIGRDVRVNRGCTIAARRSVTIGDDTMIGEFCSIRDANHGIAPDRPVRAQPHRARGIEIGADVWIGRGVCVLPGAIIEDGAVIGANSVVTGRIPAGCIAVGAPARVMGRRT